MDLKEIFDNNRQRVQSRLDIDADCFSHLAKGQSPEILYIGCSDSRVTPEQAMGLAAGDVFVHRNIANMVPNANMNVMSVIEYAVAHLKVKHVVVCGHYSCGGVKAAMDPTDLGVLNPWLRNIRDSYRTHAPELNSIADEGARYNRFVELNTQEQCLNVMKTPVVQKAVADRGLQVHGWVFDIASGKMIDLEIDTQGLYNSMRSIYDID